MNLYIREKLVKFLKLKNIFFSAIGVFLFVFSIYLMVSLIVYYWGDWETVLKAKRTPESVEWFIVGLILLIGSVISKKMIRDAYFYSSYFEGDLDGQIKYSDLTAITGKSALFLKMKLHLLRIFYMKGYSFKSLNETKYIELYSKKCTCQCRKCGAVIEKKMYFTGICPYCKSSDVFAKVITENRFYSITYQTPDVKRDQKFYLSKHFKSKKILSVCGLCLGLSVFCIALMACIDFATKYNNQEYLKKVLLSGEGHHSFELIKADILDTIIFLIGIMAAIMPLIFATVHKLKYILITDNCSVFFSKCKTPFIAVSSLPVNKKHGIKYIKESICRHYLLNCSFEKHDNIMKVALARKIIRDECPSCGAPIVGEVSESYKCEYCGNEIMNVVAKKQ